MIRKLNFACTLAVIMSLMFNSLALAYVGTDKPDYSPGSVVTISGGNDATGAPGYVAGALVNIAITGPHDPAVESGCADVIVAANGNWECKVTLWADPAWAVGEYVYTATSLAFDGSIITESGTFTDAATAKVNFITSGLPDGASVSVEYSGLNNGGNPISGSIVFTSPGPNGDVNTKPSSSLTFAFPSSVTFGGVTYTFSSSSVPSPLTHRGKRHWPHAR